MLLLLLRSHRQLLTRRVGRVELQGLATTLQRVTQVLPALDLRQTVGYLLQPVRPLSSRIQGLRVLIQDLHLDPRAFLCEP